MSTLTESDSFFPHLRLCPFLLLLYVSVGCSGAHPAITGNLALCGIDEIAPDTVLEDKFSRPPSYTSTTVNYLTRIHVSSRVQDVAAIALQMYPIYEGMCTMVVQIFSGNDKAPVGDPIGQYWVSMSATNDSANSLSEHYGRCIIFPLSIRKANATDTYLWIKALDLQTADGKACFNMTLVARTDAYRVYNQFSKSIDDKFTVGYALLSRVIGHTRASHR